MVPLARDLCSTQRRLRLKLEDRTLELDLRRPTSWPGRTCSTG